MDMLIRERTPGRLLDPSTRDFSGYDALALCAGPGGFDEANVLLGSPLRILGVETNADACATAVAAGHDRIMLDMREITPELLGPVSGLILTPPCPTFSSAGKRSGTADIQHILDAITCAGAIDCGDSCTNWRAVDELAADPRSALVAHCMALLIHTRPLQWFVAEQVPAVEEAWIDALFELTAGDVDWNQLEDDPECFDWDAPHDFGWASTHVEILEALDFAATARRRRAYMWGRHNEPSSHLIVPTEAQLATVPTMAQLLGWESGERIRTRGARRATGGNLFSANGPSWCLTGKARSWERDRDGRRLTAGEAGALNGMPHDYPWRGSRTSQFQQIGDIVNPLVAAVVLGSAIGMREEEIRSHLDETAWNRNRAGQAGATAPAR